MGEGERNMADILHVKNCFVWLWIIICAMSEIPL